MRGEYKVPGGKLVRVELDVLDGVLANVHVSGDFFLEPDSALETITAALGGLPANAPGPKLTEAIELALGRGHAPTVQDDLRDEVHMVGFDAAAVGIAVRRAVGAATGWDDHVFDVFEPVTMDPVMHVALDEYLSREVAEGRRGPLLRIWDWDSSVVVIGSFQSVRNEIDTDAASRLGVGIVRRVSGGGAMFMEPGNCITYSLVVPSSLVEGLSFEQSYAFLDSWVVTALKDVGINARYVPLNDIASDKGKIGGAAQKRMVGGAVLHHATMSYDIDATKMTQVLRVGREKLSDKGIASANKRVDPMRSQTGMARADIISSLLESFRRDHHTREATYSDSDLAGANALADSKFRTDQWTLRVP